MPTFWTIQHIEKWKEFQSTGVLIANDKFIEDYYKRPYEWISSKLNLKTPNPFSGKSGFPVWAWYKYDVDRWRPELRRRAHLEKGTRGVLIEFKESFDNALLTEFYEWHMVLNSREDEEYQREMTIISPDEVYPWHEIIIDPADEERVSKNIVRAILWGLDIKNVRNVKEFIPR